MIWGYQAEGVPEGTLLTDAAVKVVDNDSDVLFHPRQGKRATGVIFLPGGMVDPVAYAPLLKKLAGAGHPAVLMRLPMRCACTESQINDLFNRIGATIKTNRETQWYLAGHSRGAMLASRFAREAPSSIAGLVLIGTTHPREFDLSRTSLRVTKVSGALDGVAPLDAIRANKKLLPPSTNWIEIPGANHVQFGYYRYQLFDGSATISREEQQAALLKALLHLLRS